MVCVIKQGDFVKEISLEAPTLLSDVLAGLENRVEMPCGGNGRCLKCRVTASGHLSQPTRREREVLSAEELEKGVRLACMTTLLGDAMVELPRRPGDDHVLTAGQLPSFLLEPQGGVLGAAVDIGTTTLAAYLYRLEDGTLLSTASAVNPQRSYGADVITRMQHALEGEGPALARSIRQGLGGLLEALCASASLSVSQIDRLVLTGNTAMLTLLCGQSPASIAVAPFEPEDFFGREVSPKSLELPLREDVPVYLVRIISAYVGGDLTSAALAAGFADRTEGIDLLCDIGTNGEMILRHGNRFLACSTAAGPAFEGAGLHCGMSARSGAIHRVTLEQGAILSHTLDDAPAVGLCGSGIVDALAVMLSVGVLDETGALVEEGHGFEDCMTQVEDAPAFRLPHTQVVITQQDVRTVQLAKSAIAAGMTALLSRADIAPESVDRFLIAGGFGSCIDVDSAQRIGLILPGFAAKSVRLGNAAGAGASMSLLSGSLTRDSEALAERIETVELSTDGVFMEAYMEGMFFPE